MKILTQLALIGGLCLVGEVISAISPFPIPATIVALLLLFVLLKCSVLKLSWVEDTGNLLLKNMTFFFVPVGVKLMNYFDLIKDVWLLLLLLTMVVTVLTFLVTAYTVKGVLLLTSRRRKS